MNKYEIINGISITKKSRYCGKKSFNFEKKIRRPGMNSTSRCDEDFNQFIV